MKKLLLGTVAASFLLLTGCSTAAHATNNTATTTTKTNTTAQATSTPAKPKQMTAQQTAKKIIELSTYGEWSVLYSYVDPDIRQLYSKSKFVAERANNGALFSSVSKVKTQPPVMLKTWTFSSGNKKTYKNVAEVPFQLTMSGGSTYRGTMHLVKVNGKWKYFYWPAKTN